MKNIYLLFSLLLLLAVGCSEEFLDRGPISVETSDNYFDTDGNALRALYATYNVIRGEETFGMNKWAIGSVASDEAEGGGAPGGADIDDVQNLDRLIHDPSNSRVVLGSWFGYYTGLLRANLVITNVEDNENLTPELSDRFAGEAYALRALFHFELLMTFGAITVADHVLTPEEYTSPIRTPIAVVFDQIESDLDQAIKLLTASKNERIPGRIDLSGAVGLKIKALVYESSYAELSDPNSIFTDCENRWSDAQALANSFISDAAAYGVGLEPDYAMIWRMAGESSGEHLIVASSNRIAGYEGPQVSIGTTAPYETGPSTSVIATIMQMPRHYYPTLADFPDNAITSTDGWGFNTPTQKFIDQFDPDDPRLDISVVFDGAPWNFWAFGDCYLSTKDSPTGYMCKKYVAFEPAEFESTAAGNHAGNLDYKILRFADVVLLGAEANLKAGDAGEATRLVNLVRERARNSGTTGQPADYTSNVSMDEIILERSLELGLEGHRFFDLVRTGRTDEMNGANNYNATIRANITFVTGKHEFLPIPNSEIVRSNGSLTQNNGY